MARQAHALREQVKRLTVRRRIGSESESESESESNDRLSWQTRAWQSWPIDGSGERGVVTMVWPDQAVVGLCLVAVAALLHLLLHSTANFIYLKREFN